MPLKELTMGSTFAARYQVIEELGKGGMGKVYKVLDTKIKEKWPSSSLRRKSPQTKNDRSLLERAQAGPENQAQECLRDVRYRGSRGRPLHHHGICRR
jgi:serine/threonine protein kinase